MLFISVYALRHVGFLRAKGMLKFCRGANPRAIDDDGRTALQYALEGGNVDDEEIIILLADPNR